MTGRRLIDQLVGAYDKLPPPPAGAQSCPADDGSQILALAVYPNGNRVTIQLFLAGCQTATNGDVIREASGFGSPPAFGPALVGELKRLTGVR